MGVGEKIDEDVLRWFGYLERIENDRTAKGVYVGECAGGRFVGRPRKRWIDTVKNCMKKRSFDVRQAKRMVHYRSVWRWFVKGNIWGVVQGMNPLL